MLTCVSFYVTDQSGGFDGNGRVTSSPALIDCRFAADRPDPSSTCAGYFRSRIAYSIDVTLTATPDPGNLVSCNDGKPFSASPCTVTHTLSGVCSSPCADNLFDFKYQGFALSVTKSGVGSGMVTSQPAGISCGAACTETGLAYGTKLTLVATPDKGAVFQTWTGACNGQGATCTLTITADTSTNAVFGLPSSPPPSPPPPPRPTPPPPGAPPPPPPPPAPPAPSAPPRSALAARIVYATAVRHGKTRRLVVRVRVSEPARAQVRLLKHGFERLAAVASVKPGGNTIATPIPATLARGLYQLELTLRDARGQQKVYRVEFALQV